jgi:hypothetical protein
MSRRPYLAIAVTAALCAPAAALAAGHQSSGHKSANANLNCGGNGVDALYCIPQQSVFAFTHATGAPHCALKVGFTVEPKIEGLTGHAHLALKGSSDQDRHIDRTARPLVGGGRLSYTFKQLRAGPYQLTGWYEGDETRLASAHRTERVTLHCG